MSLNIAEADGSLAVVIPSDACVVGYGTYFGTILVRRKSDPTTEQPLGTMIPPLTELNLWRILLEEVRSKFVFSSNGVISVYCAVPGLLSITYSEG